MSQTEKIALAVVGIGDAFENQYWKHLTSLKRAEWEVYCLDNVSFWHRGIAARRAATRDKIAEAGFTFVDISDEAAYARFISSREFGLVILAVPDRVHIQEVRRWINAKVPQIIVEKPLSDDPGKVEAFRTEIGVDVPEKNLEKIRYFDHYRGKLHGHFGVEAFWAELQEDKGRLGNITGLRFFCLEDFSGTDDAYLTRESVRQNKISPERNGSIEVSGREGALDRGMIFDLGSHLMAVIEYLGRVSSFELEAIRAGRYVGVGDEHGSLKSEVTREDGSFVGRLMQTTKITNETFAHLKFNFADYDGERVAGEAYVGKGIRGIHSPSAFGIPLDGPLLGEVKLVELQGDTGRRAQFFLKSEERYKDESMLLIDENGAVEESARFPIGNAHKVAFDALLEPESETNVFLNFPEAAEILSKLDEIQGRIRGKVLPYYSLGRRAEKGGPTFADRPIISHAEYLDSIDARFEPLWAHDNSER